jgi:hypothetical protein
MVNRTSLLTACGALLGLMIITGTAGNLSASVRSNRLEYLTFSGPVALPGVTLARGTYTFEVANPDSSADVVRVRSRATDEVLFQGFTIRSERPDGMSQNRSVLLGEAPKGTAEPILAWYPIGDNSGHEFVYARKAR